ncbi:MAG: lipopolysaccharide biosynthesis protein RfbH [Methylococcaceae bacterium]|nr:lipopolysaccharide biosynthesis protein RfbH [Methylococcaceae bacterium]
MTCNIERGDICLLPFPFTDLSGQKKRPALALSSADAYGDVVFAFITTNDGASEQAVSLLTEHYADGCQPLPRASYLRLEKQYRLSASIILKKLSRLSDSFLETVLRMNVIQQVAPFSEVKYKPKEFIAGKTHVPVSGKVLGERELSLLVESSLDGWLTTGRFNDAFEKKLADFIGIKHLLTTNSGSSANLLALAALTSDKLGAKALKSGDEIITVAAGFPTTVNPALQYGLVPVFVDIELETYNIDAQKIAAAITDKTRAIMLAHTLGNAFNLDEVIRLARKYDLWVIEDCCDALGTTYAPAMAMTDYKGQVIESGVARHVGTFGDIATLSFYPAHHITMGEGGAVFTNHGKLRPIIESFRDWGRDCFCPPGQDNTCKKRFCQQLGSLPEGYDHKYTYSHVGYNLKITDMQAAVGLAQMERLEGFIAQRRANFDYLSKALVDLQDKLILPKATSNSVPSWFGYPITIREEANVDRVKLLQYLDSKNIGSRLLFAGNLTRQPYFQDQVYRVSGELTNTDAVMNNGLWLGVCPMLTTEMLDFVVSELKAFFAQ